MKHLLDLAPLVLLAGALALVLYWLKPPTPAPVSPPVPVQPNTRPAPRPTVPDTKPAPKPTKPHRPTPKP